MDLSGIHQGDEGIDEVRWFTKEEVEQVETHPDIKQEAAYVFAHFPHE